MVTTDNSKIIIKFKEKEYEIENKKDEQKVKPKGGKDTDKEITVKNYEEGSWNHTCECSEDGTKFDKINVKWGKGKHITIWGGGSVIMIVAGLLAWYFLFKNKDKEEEEES